MARIGQWLEAWAAWEWAEHQQRPTRTVHCITNTVSATCLLLLAARVEVPLPLAGLDVGLEAVPLSLLCWIGVTAYLWPLDARVVVLLTALLSVPTAGFGLLYQPHGWASGVATLAVFCAVGFVAVKSHEVFTDHHQADMSDPPGGMFLRTLHAALLGCVPFTLFFLLDRGYRPALRARLQAASRRFFSTQHAVQRSNWAQTVRFEPREVHYPKTVDEIVDLVTQAREEGRRIRCIGTAYSWSAVAKTDDILVSLRCMDSVELDLSSPDRPLAIVGAGADGRALNRVCQARGLAMPANVVMETVSWGGMVACGAHGSGWNTGTLSDYVHAVELVDGEGRPRRFEAGVDAPDIMDAVRLHLGLLGIVHRITLRLGPNHNVRHANGAEPPAQVLAALERNVPAHDYYDIYWWPGSEVAWVRTWDVTDEPLDPSPLQRPWDLWGDRERSWSFWISWLQIQCFRPVRWLLSSRESIGTAWTRLTSLCTPRWTRVTSLLSATHYRQAIEVTKVGCVEFALPIDGDFGVVRQAWSLMVETMQDFERRGQYPLSTVVNLRFIGESHALLSPARGNPHTCYIEALGDLALASWPAFAQELTRRWMTLPGARPHWGKQWDVVPEMGQHMRRIYGTDLQRFLELRRQLDPGELFVNDLMGEAFDIRERRAPMQSGFAPARQDAGAATG